MRYIDYFQHYSDLPVKCTQPATDNQGIVCTYFGSLLSNLHFSDQFSFSLGWNELYRVVNESAFNRYVLLYVFILTILK